MSAEKTSFANNGAQPLTLKKQFSHEFTDRESSYKFRDDFELYSSIPDFGSRANGSPWVKKIVGAAPPTLTLAADAAGGVMTSTLTADSQKQEATGCWDDSRHWDITAGGGIFQGIAKLTTLPTLAAECGLGLIGDWADGGMLGPTYSAGFIMDVAGAVSCVIDDNVTPQNVSAGVTMVVNTWYIFRIDFSTITGVKFFINGAVVAGSSTFGYAATGANAILQPYYGCYKVSGAGLGVAQCQRVQFWTD